MIRVLIVDDDKLARKGLISIMPWSKWGMEVVGEAANGLKAMEFLSRELVDLMFVDLSMPVMSGIELMQQARPLYPALQFVVLTFHEDFDYVQTCIRLGALDYISKLKMETEDYNSIFERIAERFRKKEPSFPAQAASALPSPLPAAAPSPETRIQDTLPPLHAPCAANLERRWINPQWLFDDMCFDRLCKDTLAARLTAPLTAAMLTRGLAAAEALTHLPASASPAMGTPDEAVSSLRQYRESLHNHAAHSQDLSTTAICMLKSARYIRDHIAEPLHTDTVANHVNMSRSYFCQCFKRQFGLTFNEYVRSRRIHLAKDYLLRTQQPISWISQAVGYGDIKYFSHVFREQEGILPSEYRAHPASAEN